jgi:hypothetical protein
MQLKVGLTKGKKATYVNSSLDMSFLWGGFEKTADLSVTVPVVFECAAKEFHFLWETLLVADSSSPVYQGG